MFTSNLLNIYHPDFQQSIHKIIIHYNKYYYQSINMKKGRQYKYNAKQIFDRFKQLQNRKSSEWLRSNSPNLPQIYPQQQILNHYLIHNAHIKTMTRSMYKSTNSNSKNKIKNNSEQTQQKEQRMKKEQQIMVGKESRNKDKKLSSSNKYETLAVNDSKISNIELKNLQSLIKPIRINQLNKMNQIKDLYHYQNPQQSNNNPQTYYEYHIRNKRGNYHNNNNTIDYSKNYYNFKSLKFQHHRQQSQLKQKGFKNINLNGQSSQLKQKGFKNINLNIRKGSFSPWNSFRETKDNWDSYKH